MKYPSPPAHSIPSSTSPQLLDNNYSLFVFHVFYISSFRWQCNGAFLRKSHKVYPSVVWRLIWVSADQTIEKLGVLACTWESQWDLLRTNAGQVKPSICHSQLIGWRCNVPHGYVFALQHQQSAFGPCLQSDPAFSYKVGVLRIYCGFLCGNSLIWTHVWGKNKRFTPYFLPGTHLTHWRFPAANLSWHTSHMLWKEEAP